MATDINISLKDKLVKVYMSPATGDKGEWVKLPEVIMYLTAEEAKVIGKGLIDYAEKLELGKDE